MKNQKGFTLVELLVSVGLLAIVSLVSVNIITTLIRSSVKAQMAIDIEQASSFVFLKMENDIKKSYSATTTGSTLTLKQGSSASPVIITYRLAGCSRSIPLNCVFVKKGLGPDIKLTDDSVSNGTPTLSAVSIDLAPANSSFSIVNNASGNPAAVGVKIKFIKPSASGTKMFDAETTLDTVVVLRGSY